MGRVKQKEKNIKLLIFHFNKQELMLQSIKIIWHKLEHVNRSSQTKVNTIHKFIINHCFRHKRLWRIVKFKEKKEWQE